MNKMYILFLSCFVFSSCFTTVQYVGQSLKPTKQVDVYVTKESIKQSFEIIGKGYVNSTFVNPNVEVVQKEAIMKAREKGADAILITDQYIFTGKFGVIATDSLQQAGISTMRSGSTQELIIYFIKYNKS